MKNILFVDDDPKIIDGLKRLLRSKRDKWNIMTALSGMEALDILNSQPCDVIVSDIRMVGMNGVELLTKVKFEYSSIVRIALSGYADTELMAECVQATHQFLNKPCDLDTLMATISRACTLKESLMDDNLINIISKLDRIPSLPSLYTEIMEEFSSADGSIKKVGEIISQDVAMTAKILQIVNSAYFGLARQVASPVEAAGILGFDVIRSLVLSVKIFSKFESVHASNELIQSILVDSAKSGALAKDIAVATHQDKKTCDYAQMAGMLQDIGIIVLLDNYPDVYTDISISSTKQTTTVKELEEEKIGANHMDVGAYLLSLWGLPYTIVEVVAYHHNPGKSPTDTVFSPLTAVHIANSLISNTEQSPHWDNFVLDTSYISKIGLSDQISTWQENMLQTGTIKMEVEDERKNSICG